MKYKFFISGLFLFILLPISLVLAETSDSRIIENPLKVDSIMGLLTLVLDIVVQVGLVVVVFFIIFAGFQFVTAQGDTGKITKARETLVATLIGSAIILGCYAIASALKSTVGQLTKGVTIERSVKNFPFV